MGPLINSQKGPFITFLLFCSFLVSEISCSSLIKKTSHPVKLSIPVEEKSILADILAKTSERLHYLNDLKAIAEISVQFPTKKIKRKSIIIFRNDLSIRFEVLSMSGQPFMYFVADSEKTVIYYPDNNILYKGNYSSKNINRIIGINLDLEDIIANLSGTFNIPSRFQNIVLNESKDYYLIKFFLAGSKTKEVFINKESYLPVKLIEYSFEEKEIIKVQFSEYKEIANYFLPFMIKIEAPQKKRMVLIKYKTVLLNQGVPDSSFTIPVSEGVKIELLENNQ